MTEVVFKVATPKVPNFLRFDDEKIDGTISIADVPNEQLRQIGQAWTDNLIKRADEIRAGR